MVVHGVVRLVRVALRDPGMLREEKKWRVSSRAVR